jgi:hypothetical protein
MELAAAFIWMAFSRLSYPGLFAGMLLAMVSFRFSMTAYQGLIALIGQEDLMTGRLSTLWNVFNTRGGGLSVIAFHNGPSARGSL